MVYDWFGDEYGKISFAQEVDVSPLGSVLELIVSHCDPTINLFDRFYVTQNGKVIDVWEIDLRGRSQ
jgi:D-serine deaminase-like pyridoxal phosphate-dependent protein